MRPDAEFSKSENTNEEWDKLSKRVKIYGGVSLGGAILASVVLGHPWLFWDIQLHESVFPGSSWAFHFVEIPIVAYIVFAGYYALFRSTRANVHRLQQHLGFVCMVQLAFLCFEGMTLVNAFQRDAEWEEKLIYALGGGLMIIGAAWGQWLRLRVNDYVHPPLDPRFEHPRTEAELIQLVRRARAQRVQLRVRGSGHLKPCQGTWTDEGFEHINVQLDRYNQIVHWDEERKRVTVQAGCHLGVDPGNPRSNKKNSLLWQLDERGWALPDLGGITQQTVSGFVSTGSMGGTIQHDFGGSIIGLRLIDGRGRVHDLAPNPGKPDDEQTNLFYAAGVSMGLLGVVSTVTFQCVERYDIEGENVTTDADEVLAPGRLSEALTQHEYTRLLWWPQQGVERVEHWRAARREGGRARELGKLERVSNWYERVSTRRFKRRPFASVPRILQWLIVNPFYRLLAKDELPYEERTEALARRLLRAILRKGTKSFTDFWYEGLPMDNQISVQHVPTDFTELFIDISQADEVVRLLKEFFNPDPEGDPEGAKDAEGMNRTGAYAFELYPGHRSRFWMSPAYDANHSFRLDVFWFRTPEEGRDRFFKQFWDLLRNKGIDFRVHWGKYLPAPDSSAGAKYLSERYPMWGRFMEARKKMDPHGIFLSTYWRQQLGLPAADLARVPAQPVLPRKVQAPGLAARVERFKEKTRPRVIRGQIQVSLIVLKAYFGLIDLVLEGLEWASGHHSALRGATVARREVEANA
jgi:FAD/FMN-containing dehydrogenase